MSTATTTISAFIGNDLEQWKTHFGISRAIGEVLTTLGVTEVSDLDFIYDDEDGDLLPQIKAVCSAVEFGKFKKARAYTNPVAVPEASPLPAAVVATPYDPSITGTMPPPPPDSVAKGTKTTATKTSPPKPHASATTGGTAVAPTPSTTVMNEAKLRELRENNERKERERLELERRLREEMERSVTTNAEIRDAEKTIKEIRKRKDLIVSIHNQLKEAASVDMLFLVDCTGSMSPYLSNMCSNIIEFTDNIKRLHPLISLRLAFVGYRDHCDGSNRLSISNFTSDIEVFRAYVESQKKNATGGGDQCEDVLGGVNAASNLEWTSQTRVLYHVADAPAHGTEFHNGCGDDYPGGDPNGLNAATLLNSLKSKNVLYFFGRINTSTDKMIQRFNELAGKGYVVQESVKDTTFMETVTKSVSRTVSESVSSSARTADKGAKKEVVIDTAIPNFATVPTEMAQKFNLVLPKDLNELITAMSDECIESWPESTRYSYKVGPRPFAKGATRAAYYAQLVPSAAGRAAEDVILKESLSLSESELTKEKYKGFLSCQRASIFLANQFNRVKPASAPSISFCDTYIVQFMDRPKQPYMIAEQRLHGNWEKFNNNNGYCAPCPTEHGTNHEVIQAFSHWTYEVSGGNFMVVDCQGTYDRSRNAFLLTDPALHCKNVLRFGKTNMGTVGFTDFFKGHVCNGTCAAMGLTAKA